MFYNTFDFYKYLNDLTRGDCFLNDLVRNKLVNREVISSHVDVYGDKALDMAKYFNSFYKGNERLSMQYAQEIGAVYVQISFKLAVEFLRYPEEIFGEGFYPSYAFEFDNFLEGLVEYIRDRTYSFVEKIKQEQLELERKKEQEQLELERKKEQEQLEKEKEGNEKKLKQNKIDTIVSYFFNRNLN